MSRISGIFLAIGNDHRLSPASIASACRLISWTPCSMRFGSGRNGLRPNRLMRSTIVVTISANRGPFGGREVEHLQSFRLQADLGEELPGPLHPPPRPQVAFQEMAAALQAAGHDHAVDAPLERGQDVVHFQLARAGQPQHTDIARILQTHRPGQIRRGVGAVVAAEGQDQRFVVHRSTSTLAPTRRGHADLLRVEAAPTWRARFRTQQPVTAARIWRRRSAASVIAMAGHSEVQLPQPMQVAPCTSALLNSLICGAMYGQTCTQVMQEMHLSGSTQAVWPLTGIFFRDRIDAARPATAWAWAIASLRNFGAWAVPHRNSPSLAKSTGRSFMWASRKKPSAFSGTRSRSDSSCRSARGHHGSGQHHQVRRQLQVASQRRLPDPQLQPPVDLAAAAAAPARSGRTGRPFSRASR